MAKDIRPDHYTDCSIECIDAMEITFGPDNAVLFCVMNAFKYLWRHKSKGGLEDLVKARTYINMAYRIDGQSGSGKCSEVISNIENVLTRYTRQAERNSSRN